MTIFTVFAAALAAGLTTFAASAPEEGVSQASILSALPGWWSADTGIAQDMFIVPKDDTTELAQKAKAGAGLTGEEVFHVRNAPLPRDRYRPLVERYASENGVTVELAHAVITVESNYKVYSLGKAGEVGLMQIKPATAKLMGYEGTKTGLFDPETNIKYGLKYLGEAQRRGDGTTCGTILKYNAGHAAKRMNATSRDYCEKVKRHLAEGRTAALDADVGRLKDNGV